MRTPTSTAIGWTCGVAGLGLLAGALFLGELRMLGLLGLPLLFLALSILGRTGRDARSLAWLVGRTVSVEAWGLPLPGHGGTRFQVEAVTALGAALWVHLRCLPAGPALKLKIAQPTALDAREGRVEIGFAGYLQWDGRRIPGPAGQRAPGTVVLTVA